ncbi:MAG: trehalose-6-phosphate synthase [Bacteroidales bacterium]
MKRLFIASYKLPFNISFNSAKIEISEEIGARSSRLENFYSEHNARWVGCTGIDDHEFTEKESSVLRDQLGKYNCTPIIPPVGDYHNFLHGFSKNTIWPLFHYFNEFADYQNEYWESYVKVKPGVCRLPLQGNGSQ